MAKTKALISCAINAQHIFVFVFAYAYRRFSYDAVHLRSGKVDIHNISITVIEPFLHPFRLSEEAIFLRTRSGNPE